MKLKQIIKKENKGNKESKENKENNAGRGDKAERKERRKLAKEKRAVHREMMRNANRKYLRNGSYSVAVSVIFVMIIVFANMIISSLPTQYTEIDLSEDQIYSIGKQTKDLLAQLKEEISIYQITSDGSADETITNLLKKYEDGSSYIHVMRKDPVVNPKFTASFTEDRVAANSLIVVCGDRSKVVPYDSMYETETDYTTYSTNTTGFDGEGQISSAIAYVTSDNLPVLYTLEGHGEQVLSAETTNDIEKANIVIKELNLLTEEQVPEDAALLLIASPVSDISENEKDAILAYLEKGGKAIIFSDYTEKKLTNFDAVLDNYGVERQKGIVFEEDSQHYAMQMPYFLLPTIENTEVSANAAGSGRFILMPYAQGISEKEKHRDTLNITSILTTSEKAYSKADVNGSTFEKEDEDVDGSFALGVYIQEAGEEAETQIAYFSTVNLLDESVNSMVSGGNEQLFMEVLNTLCVSGDAVTVSIPSKNLAWSYLNMSSYDSAYWKVWTIVGIPFTFLILGFVVWTKRRKA